MGNRGGGGLVLAGDVMTGRGVDQILGHPGSRELREEHVHDARSYVDLAERVNGSIPAPVAASWPWGELLDDLPDDAWRVMNLETSVTRSSDWARGKAVHYRMNPDNIDCLRAAEVDVWTLANNHVLDFGTRGLVETLDVLEAVGQRFAGAGRDAEEAWRPAVVGQDGARLLVWSVAHASSGVTGSWAAVDGRPGVALLRRLDDAVADDLARRVEEHRRPGDLVVVSVHWGSNWGYQVPAEQRRFAHRLLDAGVHVVHGHSSHHPRPVELHGGGLVLYGCGDLVNDYEGIGGYEQYRDDLRLLYHLPLVRPESPVTGLRAVPFRARRLRLEHASPADGRWLADTLRRHCAAVGTDVHLEDDGTLRLSAR